MPTLHMNIFNCLIKPCNQIDILQEAKGSQSMFTDCHAYVFTCRLRSVKNEYIWIFYSQKFTKTIWIDWTILIQSKCKISFTEILRNNRESDFRLEQVWKKQLRGLPNFSGSALKAIFHARLFYFGSWQNESSRWESLSPWMRKQNQSLQSGITKPSRIAK